MAREVVYLRLLTNILCLPKKTELIYSRGKSREVHSGYRVIDTSVGVKLVTLDLMFISEGSRVHVGVKM